MTSIILDQPEHFHLVDVDLAPQPDQDTVLMHVLRGIGANEVPN